MVHLVVDGLGHTEGADDTISPLFVLPPSRPPHGFKIDRKGTIRITVKAAGGPDARDPRNDEEKT